MLCLYEVLILFVFLFKESAFENAHFFLFLVINHKPAPHFKLDATSTAQALTWERTEEESLHRHSIRSLKYMSLSVSKHWVRDTQSCGSSKRLQINAWERKTHFLKVDSAGEIFQDIYSVIYKMTILVSMRLWSTSAVESVSWSTKLYWT